MTTALSPQAPAVTPARLAALLDAFGLEDYSGVDVDAMSPQGAATFAYTLDVEHRRAAVLFSMLCKPLLDAKSAARAKVAAAIPEDGKALPHSTLVIRLEQATERDKYVDQLRRLEGIVPDQELRKALFLDQPEPQWKVNLVQLDKIAREYGGEIAEIIEKATPRKPKGTPTLIIEARETTKGAHS
ncbi:MAG: hypothetical protein ACYC8W_06145 [Candidatus Tyrphobacter sp.]